MQEQVTDKLLRVAQDCDGITQAVKEVLIADENTDITLTDGSTTPSLSKRVKQWGGQVTKVVDKTGDVSAEDIANALELGTAAKQDASDLMQAKNLKMPNGEDQEKINDKSTTTVESIADLSAIEKPKNGQVIYVKSIEKNYTYTPSTTEIENGVTVVGKWIMEIPDAYYASWFCPDESIDNKSMPMQDIINNAYRYATDKKRPFIIDNPYYVESPQRFTGNSYPSLGDSGSLSYAIRVLSNSCLVFKKGIGKLKLVPNDQDWSRVLCFFDVENFLVFEPHCIGDKSEHLSTTGEQHFMFAVHPCKNGYIRNPIAENSWGDGFYLGFAHWINPVLVDVFQPTNIIIDNPQIYNSSRNGISLCGGKDITFNNITIDLVDRIAPIAGIDIEPEEDLSFGHLMSLENITMHNTTIKNALNYGVASWLVGNRHVEVNFTGVTAFIANKSNTYMTNPLWIRASMNGLSESDYKPSGYINFDHVTIDDTGAKYPTISISSSSLPMGKVKSQVNTLEVFSAQYPPNIYFGVPTVGNMFPHQSGTNIKNFVFHKDTYVINITSDTVVPNNKLASINLDIPESIFVTYRGKGFIFGDDTYIGGHDSIQNHTLNENQLINNVILVPMANPSDSNSIYSRVLITGKNRKLSYSLPKLSELEAGNGLQVAIGDDLFLGSNSKFASMTITNYSNRGAKVESSFGEWVSFY